MPVENTVTVQSLDVPIAAPSDAVGMTLDSLIAALQQLDLQAGTWLAIGLAALLVVRMAWKKYKASKK